MRRAAVLLGLACCGRVGFESDLLGGATQDGSSTDGSLTVDSCGLTGLLLYLAFDEADGTLAFDSSGNGHHGTLAGFDNTTRITGRKGNALHFDGVDDRVDIGSPAGLDDIRPITACAWATLAGPISDGFATIIDKSLDGYSEGWNLYMRDNGTIGFFTNHAAFIEGSDVMAQTWHYICGAWDGTANTDGIQVFLDGNRESADVAGGGTTVMSDSTHAMTIGRSTAGTFALFGSLDELRIYNRVMDVVDIEHLVACSSQPP